MNEQVRERAAIRMQFLTISENHQIGSHGE